ncbi:MAG: hypothetical protein LYZ70_00095 [Nitrososphaerales archaeon]|nr:hypothetical protein [Nitrososphaerales archaeon]
MSYGPTERCSFCGGLYYVQKLAVHEGICSSRPKRLTVGRAVRLAIKSHPEASRNRALLVRLVWQIRDRYRAGPARMRLTEPGRVLRALSLYRRARRSAVRQIRPDHVQPRHSPKFLSEGLGREFGGA